jgi:hypothetical protein
MTGQPFFIPAGRLVWPLHLLAFVAPLLLGVLLLRRHTTRR